MDFFPPRAVWPTLTATRPVAVDTLQNLDVHDVVVAELDSHDL
jgi:hypothetical protein